MAAVIFNIVMPLFGIMAAGYVAGRYRMLPDGGSEVLGRFVFVVALPALIFISLARVSVTEFFDWPYIATLGGGMLATFCLGLVVARLVFPGTLTAHGLHALTAMYSSTGYVGLPLILYVFGDAGLLPGIVGTVMTGACFLPLAVIVAEIDRARREGRASLRPLGRVMANPMLLATAAGLAASAAAIPIPAPVGKFCDLLGGAFIPCALFSAGLFMAGNSVEGEGREVAWLVVVKLIIHPLVTWWLAYFVFGLGAMLATIAVLQAALPAGVPVFVLAQQYRTFEARSNAAIVISTVLSVITLSALLILLDVQPP